MIDGNNTFCESASNEIYISQPVQYENSFTKVDPLSCSYADGYIYVTLDEATLWDITWTNTVTGQSNQAFGQSGMYTISDLGPGTYEVITNANCGEPIIFETTLVDNNDVVAGFTLPADTIYLTDGGLVEFTNTSENADNFYWIYNNSSSEVDSTYNGSYTYTEPGVYGVTLIAQNGASCTDLITQEIVVMADPSGVNELANGIIRSYIAYGNGNPQYVIELTENTQVQIQMVNPMGQIISSKQVNVNGKTVVDLPTYDLSSGIYLIITLDDGTRIDTKKLFVR